MHGVVLIVEDDGNDLVLMRRTLAAIKLKNPLHICRNGEEVISYLKDSKEGKNPLPILILLDLKLPRHSGAEVLAWMDARPMLHSIPVIAVTAQTDRKQLAQAFHLGVLCVLKKPVEEAALIEALKTTNQLRLQEDSDGLVMEAV